MTALGISPALPFIKKTVHPGQAALSQAVLWLDAARSEFKGGLIKNLGTYGAVLDARVGSTANFARIKGGGLVLSGIAGNYAYVDDAASLGITGDIEIVVRVAKESWATGSTVYFVNKRSSATTQSFRFGFGANVLYLITSPDGTDAAQVIYSKGTTLTEGQAYWLKVTLDIDNGAANSVATFYQAADQPDEPTSWTNLGTSLQAVTSIFNSTSPVEIGSSALGTANNTAGVMYRSIIRNGIAGTKVLDLNFNVSDFSRAVTDTSGNAHVCRIISTQPGFINGGALHLQGVSGNYVNVLDSAALDITGDIEMVARVKMPSWASNPGAQPIITKRGGAGQYSYRLTIETTGRPSFKWTTDGSTALSRTASAAPPIADETPGWIKATYNASTGDATFYYAADQATEPTTWTQLGSVVSGAASAIWAGTADVQIGAMSNGTATFATCAIYNAIIRNGIGGTTVMDVDFSDVSDMNASGQFTSNTGGIMSLVSTFDNAGRPQISQYVGEKYLYFPSVTGSYLSTPDAASLDITSDLEIVMRLAADDWTPSAQNKLLSKWDTATNNRSYELSLSTAGLLVLSLSPDGLTEQFPQSTVALPFVDKRTYWIKVTWRDSDNRTQFFYAEDSATEPSSWTQLGADVTGAVAGLFNSNATLYIAALGGVSQPFAGRLYRTIIRNGIGGSTALDINATVNVANGSTTSFTATSGQTITIFRPTAGRKIIGVTQNTWQFTTDDFLEVATHDILNMGATDSFSIVAVARRFSAPSTYGRLVSKRAAAAGYEYLCNDVNNKDHIYVNDGAFAQSTAASVGTYTFGESVVSIGVRKVADDTLTHYHNATAATPSANDTTISSLSNTNALTIGRNSGGTDPLTGEIVAVAVFRSALTAQQITDITNFYEGQWV